MFLRSMGLRALLAVALTTGASLAPAVEEPERLVPFDKLDAAAQERVRQVVPGYTFYHKVNLPKPLVRSRYDIFEYLINHFDQCSIVGQQLKVVEYRSEKRPDGSYYADNHKGAKGVIWPLYAAPGERLYFAHGEDNKGEPVAGLAVVVFRYHETKPGAIECELHGFVKVDSWMQRLCALLFLPFVTSTVDKRFSELVDVPLVVSEMATADPAKVLKAMDALSPEDAAMLKEFRSMLERKETRP
jgi:hypothetical protein